MSTRQIMCAHLCEHSRVFVEGERAPTDEDREEVAAVMLDAYQGTVDDDGESILEARVEVDKTFDGDYGRLLAEYSRVIVRDSKIVSALLITEWQSNPFVAFAMTAKNWQRQGLSRSCMINAMQDLHEARRSTLELAVTIKNRPAVSLYASLGFVPRKDA